MDKIFSISCDVCGADIYEGEVTYATGSGIVEEKFNGHSPLDEGYHTVACDECGRLISDFIASLEVERKG